MQAIILKQPHFMQCLVDNLMAARDEAGVGMEDKALRDELMTLLIAGQETSAIVLAWTCALLAHNPVEQSRVHAEISKELQGGMPGPQNAGYGLALVLLHKILILDVYQ